MARSDDLHSLPAKLPVPLDDGGCDHLEGLSLPPIALRSTGDREVDLSALAGRTVVYAYPRTGRPDRELPRGWNSIPGARGCTPQSCSFRDHKRELDRLGARVFGLSTQASEYQREAALRLRLGFELLSDSEHALTNALGLPTFTIDDMRLIKRLTLILRDGSIEHVLYPVFPPDASAASAVQWLMDQPAGS